MLDKISYQTTSQVNECEEKLILCNKFTFTRIPVQIVNGAQQLKQVQYSLNKYHHLHEKHVSYSYFIGAYSNYTYKLLTNNRNDFLYFIIIIITDVTTYHWVLPSRNFCHPLQSRLGVRVVWHRSPHSQAISTGLFHVSLTPWSPFLKTSSS